MSKLVEELKQEHKDITSVLVNIQQIGASSAKSVEQLLETRNMLLNHLHKEDTLLYPVLYQKAQNDAALQKTLETFASEMKTITTSVLEFYKKYELGIKNREEFIVDISKFIVALKSRIMKEEVAIYKSYEKLGVD